MFNKIILFAPVSIGLNHTLVKIFKKISGNVELFDVRNSLSASNFKINAQMFRFPDKYRIIWEKSFFNKINKIFINKINLDKPDIIFVYNSEFLLPETCKIIKDKNIKLVFFMADNPYYTPMNRYYLSLLIYADLILSPDSFWISQMKTLGFKNVKYFTSGIDSENYFKLEQHEINKFIEIPSHELLYVGTNYVDGWGYKKALFMNNFVDFNFQIYGNRHWKKWFQFFPELEGHFTLSGYIPTKTVNTMFNKSKLIPIDGNPAILNGFHLRLLEALGSGAMPLTEFRNDINDILLKDCNVKLPQIDNYSKAKELANYYLSNDKEREALVNELRNFTLSHYSYEKNSQRLLEYLNN